MGYRQTIHTREELTAEPTGVSGNGSLGVRGWDAGWAAFQRRRFEGLHYLACSLSA